MQLDPEESLTLFWSAAGADEMQMSLDDGVTWTGMSPGVKNEVDGWVWTFCGYAVDPVPDGVTQVVRGTTNGIVRIQNLPRIKPQRFHIVCY